MASPNAELRLLLLSLLALFASVLADSSDDQVETNLQFYMHDNVLVPNPSSIVVAGPNASSSNSITSFNFGNILVMDDALTQGPSSSSKPVGRAQGTYMFSSLDASSVLLTFTSVFSEQNGTLSFHGADKLADPSREIAVVGGTGVFRFAEGYAVLTTQSFAGASAVIHYNVTIRVPKSSPVIASPASLGDKSSAAAVQGCFPSSFLPVLLLIVALALLH